MADSTGQLDIRGENIQRAVNGFALMEYKLKQVCLVQSSNKWKETYYKETATELTGHAVGSDIRGTARLASFPYMEPTWTETSSRHEKYAAEGVVSWEDAATDSIDVLARTLLRIGRAIANAVDYRIYDVITADASVNTAAASDTWDSATLANRDPIGDILTGIEYCAIDNYDVMANGYLLVSPTDYAHLMMNSKVINNPSFKTADVVSNGVVGQVCGLKIIVSNAVDTDEACIIKGQEAVTWKSASPLKVAVIEDQGIKYTIRAWEVGITMVTNPEAIHIITNTQA